MPTLIIASAVPAPIVPTGISSFATDNVPLVAMSILQGSQSPVVSDAFNRNQVRNDYGARYATGGNCIGEGFGLSVSSGLNISIAAGTFVSDGLLWTKSAYVLTLPANQARVWIWAVRVPPTSTDPATLSFTYKTDLTVPTGGVGIVGSCATNGTTVIGPTFDTSGVVYSKSGQLWRTTGDTGIPSDSPPASWRGFTQTTGGLWFWDGSMHHPYTNFLTLTKTTIPTGFAECIPAGYESSVFGAFSIVGALTVKGLYRSTS